GRSNALVQSMLKEAVDSARTHLLQGVNRQAVKVVMVASPAPGEGKTSLSCHLAASFSRAGRKTLLIDGDLRKPDVHAVFGKPNGAGLSGVLRNECGLADAVVESGLPDLHLLPAGTVDERVLRALAGDGLASLMQVAGEEYDFVIVDSSPVLAVSDALIFAPHVDGVVLASLEGETRMHRLGTAAERIARAGGRVIGVIVNGTRGGDQIGYYQYSRYLVPVKKVAGA
ncbi:MAG: CpsD/CapB family tyrosine-protein kinase, partial [Gemmataceae bacterium]